ncbi:MAG: potassium channel family protein [Eubacterium sp.]|nr:potassium channel family protein [Eubacterium sp.]
MYYLGILPCPDHILLADPIRYIKQDPPEVLCTGSPLGLLLLIVTFSFIFRVTEPGIVTYEDALWYCFAIVTTIGFGDITAVSRVGRALSVILGIYGIIVVALITSVIVNFYTEVKDEEDRKESEAKAGADAEADAQENVKETDPETTEKDECHGPEENEKPEEGEKS